VGVSGSGCVCSGIQSRFSVAEQNRSGCGFVGHWSNATVRSIVLQARVVADSTK
jgi:hypothetical protein